MIKEWESVVFTILGVILAVLLIIFVFVLNNGLLGGIFTVLTIIWSMIGIHLSKEYK